LVGWLIRYSDAITDLFGNEGVEKKVESSEVVHTSNITGAACSLHTIQVDRGMTWGAASERLNAYSAQKSLSDAESSSQHIDHSGFYESKREVPGRRSKGLLLALKRRGDERSYIIAVSCKTHTTCTCLRHDPFLPTLSFLLHADGIRHASAPTSACLASKWTLEIFSTSTA
jgi:hypothetical protein